jgi:hypothetical protein
VIVRKGDFVGREGFGTWILQAANVEMGFCRPRVLGKGILHTRECKKGILQTASVGNSISQAASVWKGDSGGPRVLGMRCRPRVLGLVILQAASVRSFDFAGCEC